MVSAQFLPVNGESYKLEDIIPVGDDLVDNINIKVLDAYGRTADGFDFTWVDYIAEVPCWIDGEYNVVEGVTFQPGQGLWIYGVNSSQKIRTAGQVGSSDILVNLREGAIGTGNPFPVDVALQDIIAEGDDTVDNVNIKILDAFGRTIDGCDYTWVDYIAENPCWVDGEYNVVENVTFAPGQGLWVYGTSTEQAIRFPAPEL